MINLSAQESELAAAVLVDSGAGDVGAAEEQADEGALNSFANLQSLGDAGFLRELIDLYMTEAGTRINSMRIAVAADNDEALQRAAHALKGSSATLGLIQISQICESLERINLPDQSDRVDGLIQLLLYRFGKARAKLIRALNTPDLACQNCQS